MSSKENKKVIEHMNQTVNRFYSIEDEKKYTNFVVDWQGRLFFCYFDGSSTVETRYWSDISANQTKINITTRDIDFGDPSHIKKVYKVYVSFKTGAADTNVKVTYGVNGN